MNKMFKISKRIGVLWAILIFATAVFADRPTIANFGKVNEGLFRGAQPKNEQFLELKEIGVRTVVDLRGDDDRAKAEEAAVTSAGMKFINISLNNWTRPDKSKIDEIVKLLLKPENQPVFVHCKRGSDRTGIVIAVYRMTQDGWDAKRANEEAKSFGFGWWQFWMKDFINDYYRDLKKPVS